MHFEVVTRLGDTLLEVALTGDHAVAGIAIVRAGKIVGDASGRIGLVDYEIRATTAPPRTLRHARGAHAETSSSQP